MNLINLLCFLYNQYIGKQKNKDLNKNSISKCPNYILVFHTKKLNIEIAFSFVNTSHSVLTKYLAYISRWSIQSILSILTNGKTIQVGYPLIILI